MKYVVTGLLMAILATASGAAVFERYLSNERPLDRAILSYLELERSGKASSWDLANLGVLLLEKGFPTDAERYLRKALAADKHNFEAAYRLGLVLQRQGDDRGAIKYYGRTLKARPGHGYARFMLAMAEEHCGRRAAAIRDYAKAYHFVPELADPRRNPLVLDSELQAEAALRRYQERKLTSTLKVTPLDPDAVKRMMEAKPASAKQSPEANQPAVVAPPPPQPVPAQPAPTPPPVTQTVVAPPVIPPEAPTPVETAPAAPPVATPRAGPVIRPRAGPARPVPQPPAALPTAPPATNPPGNG
jgi:Flp pilus assembly protein TadD